MKINFLQEFKQFAMRGNVIDLAVGVVIGGAFGKIVSSLVGDIFMPLIGLLTNGVNFTDIKLTLRTAELDAAGVIIKPALTLGIGNVVQVIFDFVIVAFAIFMFIKTLNKLNKKQEEPATPAGPSKEEQLLTEIRDLLKEKKN